MNLYFCKGMITILECKILTDLGNILNPVAED